MRLRLGSRWGRGRVLARSHRGCGRVRAASRGVTPLRSGAFRWLLLSTVLTYLGTGAQQTATAWLALDAAGGAFTVGLVLAARMVPNLLFGLAAGTIADRGDRARQLAIVRLTALPIMLALAWVAAEQPVNIWELVALSFGTGCLSVFDAPARQALVLDTVPREVAPNAMALNATAGRLFTAVGAFFAGALIPAGGVGAAFVAAAAVFTVTALLGFLVRPRDPLLPARAPFSAKRKFEASRGASHEASHGAEKRHADVTKSDGGAHSDVRRAGAPSFGQALREAGRLIVDVSEVRVLILAAIACEVLGFSYQTAVPALARDVLAAGVEGLGTLNASAQLGGAVGVVCLSLLPARLPRQPVLGLVFVVYGASLLALAGAGSVLAAAVVLLITGACAASFDVLQQTLMQLAVPEEQRGRAVGVWVLGIGSAPIGNLEMGTLVAVIGAPMALAINGGVLLVAAAVLLVRAPVYRLLPAAARRRSV